MNINETTSVDIKPQKYDGIFPISIRIPLLYDKYTNKSVTQVFIFTAKVVLISITRFLISKHDVKVDWQRLIPELVGEFLSTTRFFILLNHSSFNIASLF